ncbi:hypothetical protein LPJ58_004343, partial [Coemansia sp. RSA 1591]
MQVLFGSNGAYVYKNGKAVLYAPIQDGLYPITSSSPYDARLADAPTISRNGDSSDGYRGGSNDCDGYGNRGKRNGYGGDSNDYRDSSNDCDSYGNRGKDDRNGSNGYNGSNGSDDYGGNDDGSNGSNDYDSNDDYN